MVHFVYSHRVRARINAWLRQALSELTNVVVNACAGAVQK